MESTEGRRRQFSISLVGVGFLGTFFPKFID